MMNCSQCHNRIPDQAVFCPFCGRACRPPQPQTSQPQFPPPVGVPRPPAQRPPGGRRSKWLFILIGALSVLLVAGALLLVLRPGLKAPGKTAAAQSGTRRSGTAQEANPEINSELQTGAIQFSGQSSDYAGIKNLELKFVLSEDRSSIHDVAIQVTNLQGEVRDGSVKISTTVSRATERFTQSYPIEFDGDTKNIRLGESRIKRLRFKNGKAYALLAYTYKSSGTGAAGRAFKISFGEAEIVLTPDRSIETDEKKTTRSTQTTASATAKRTTSTSTAKKSQTTAASKSTASAATGQAEEKRRTDFNTEFLKNWDDAAMAETFGVDSIFDFKPAHPLPMHYIVVCRDGVYDPVTQSESEGGI